jgi:hypothetical protein
VTNQQLGALPVNPLWGDTYLGGQAITQNRMQTPGATPGEQIAVQSGFWSPQWSNQITGGPEMSMIAALNRSLYNKIGGGFDYSNPEIQREIAARQAYAQLINADYGATQSAGDAGPGAPAGSGPAGATGDAGIGGPGGGDSGGGVGAGDGGGAGGGAGAGAGAGAGGDGA